MKNDSLGEFIHKISDYLENEYNPDEFMYLTTDEKSTIRSMVKGEYFNNNCVNNVANKIIDYLRKNRKT